MERNIKLEGRALELAVAIDKVMTDSNAQISELKARADAIHGAAQDQAERLHKELKAALGLDESAHCHLDMTYVKEHGLAFAKTGCEEGGSLGDLLGKLFGRKAEVKAGGGLH